MMVWIGDWADPGTGAETMETLANDIECWTRCRDCGAIVGHTSDGQTVTVYGLERGPDGVWRESGEVWFEHGTDCACGTYRHWREIVVEL